MGSVNGFFTKSNQLKVGSGYLQQGLLEVEVLRDLGRRTSACLPDVSRDEWQSETETNMSKLWKLKGLGKLGDRLVHAPLGFSGR